MDKKSQSLHLLQSQKLLPLYYHDDAGVSISLMQALYEAGIRMIEYTARGAHALRNFKAMKQAADNLLDLEIGIGTIKTAGQAQQFVDAGADFIVCPTINIAVAAVVHKARLLWVPGCMTPTEIAVAEEAGAGLVKLFPGTLLGPAYVAAIKELFPGLTFIPTGGVEAEIGNLKSWFNAGVVAVGMGSKLFTPNRINEKGHAGLKRAVEEIRRLIGEVAMHTHE